MVRVAQAAAALPWALRVWPAAVLLRGLKQLPAREAVWAARA
jgi:hypothetical protein